MQFGNLDFQPVAQHLELVAAPVREALAEMDGAEVLAAPIDPDVADTAAFCERYGIRMADGANCVIVEGRRGDVVRHAVCMILATDRIDVNGAVRRLLDVKKASFAAMDTATALTAMEYGGITPIGTPAEWPILVDQAVAAGGHLVIGSGVRASKLLVTGAVLASLPNAHVVPIAKRAVPAQ
ncbi:YbaK/EbsC family protein [Naasia sp. SYSU D00057]|uniref:YbaK/EbsC family protein n=1 Tax=Naasia sp. SYSU D00057 TaxID=2817380 RepID=UPI001B305E8A|nr:YbaK/EbsC family protein [Naasia sp. SYSU D00057]